MSSLLEMVWSMVGSQQNLNDEGEKDAADNEQQDERNLARRLHEIELDNDELESDDGLSEYESVGSTLREEIEGDFSAEENAVHLRDTVLGGEKKVSYSMNSSSESFENSAHGQLEKQEYIDVNKMRILEHPKFLCISVRKKTTATMLYLTLFVVLLVVFGAFFQLAEGDAEIERNERIRSMMEKIEGSISEELYGTLTEFIDPKGTQNFVSYNADTDSWETFTWISYSSSYYYTFILSTTIGYGDIVTRTSAGKLLSIAAVIILLPIAIVTYTRVADLISSTTTRIFIRRDKQFRTVVSKYDQDNNGCLDAKELRHAFKELGIRLSKDEVEAIVNHFDYDNNGGLDVDEFADTAQKLGMKAGRVARQEFKLRFAVASLIVFVALFAILTFLFMDLDGVNSLYFTVISLTTVGLGDITPQVQNRFFFTIPLFVLLGLVALVIEAATERMQKTTVEMDRDASNKKNPRPSFRSTFIQKEKLESRPRDIRVV